MLQKDPALRLCGALPRVCGGGSYRRLLREGHQALDVAAGIAVVEAAGGRTVHLPSMAPMARTVYAGNSFLPKPDALGTDPPGV